MTRPPVPAFSHAAIARFNGSTPFLAITQRGVVFDVDHGGGSFDYTVAEVAIAQGCPPDTGLALNSLIAELPVPGADCHSE